MLSYQIDGDTVTIDKDKKAELNFVAARFYKRLGYSASDGFDFSASQHPQEQAAWAMAVEAYFLHLTSGVFD